MLFRSFSKSKSKSKTNFDERLPFHIALESTLMYLPLRALAPKALYDLRVTVPVISDWVREARHAFGSMKDHMADLVQSVRDESKLGSVSTDSDSSLDGENDGGMEPDVEEPKADLLRRLVQANQAVNDQDTANGKGRTGKSKRALSDDELYSDVFVR